MKQQAIFLMGPTAVGKTDLAVELAQRLPVDIISVDSAMVYRGMDIGTGKPGADILAVAPHQLMDICDPSQPYSVAQFCIDADLAMHNSWQQQRIPLLVGGTMLYFKALQFGLAKLPAAAPELRQQLSQEAQLIGWPAMHAKLAALDPVAAQRLNANDSQRVQRALEINLIMGQTLSASFAQQLEKKLDYKLHSFALVPENRALLHARIEQRFMNMLDLGLIAEVEALYNRGDLSTQLPSIRSVGYKQVWSYLEQQLDYSTMCTQAIAATRQLAKRQYTWLRSWPEIIKIDNFNSAALDTIIQSVLDFRNDYA